VNNGNERKDRSLRGNGKPDGNRNHKHPGKLGREGEKTEPFHVGNGESEKKSKPDTGEGKRRREKPEEKGGREESSGKNRNRDAGKGRGDQQQDADHQEGHGGDKQSPHRDSKSYQKGDGWKDLLHEGGSKEDPDGVRRNQERHLGASFRSHRDAGGNTPGGGESDKSGNGNQKVEGTHQTAHRREGSPDEATTKEDRRREGSQRAFPEETRPTPQGAARGSGERRDTEKSNRDNKEHANTGAKEEKAEETGGGVDHRVIRPEAEGEIPSKTRDTREVRRTGRSRSEENAEWTQHPRNRRTTRPGGKPKRRVAAFSQPGRRAEKETGGNLEEETGGQGNSGRKAEPNHHAHRVGKRVETGGSGGGHLGEKRMDPDGKDQRAIHRGGESALEESLQGSQQTERRPDNGRKNAGRMFEKEEGSGGADLLLDGRKIRGEPVLQLSRLRPSEEGLQAGVDLLQVRGSAHQEGLQGRKEELPELRQRGTEGSEPPSHRQMVPGVPTEAGNQSRQDSTQLSREEENRDVRDPRGTRDKFVVLQANLGRGREATDLLQAWVGWTYGGGRTDKIATLVRTGRRSIELTQFTGPTVRTVVIEGEGGDIALANVYAPPKGSLEGTLAVLENLLASRRGKPTIIAGDIQHSGEKKRTSGAGRSSI
jgi:hypothetical protein